MIGRGTGEVEPAYVFVAVMGASSYTYVEASMHRDLPSWIGAHIRAFEFFQGCPLAVVPDNWKTAVNRACRYMPDVNVTYQEMAALERFNGKGLRLVIMNPRLLLGPAGELLPGRRPEVVERVVEPHRVAGRGDAGRVLRLVRQVGECVHDREERLPRAGALLVEHAGERVRLRPRPDAVVVVHCVVAAAE